MWQFTADTARHYGLRVGTDYDGRLSVTESTAAALNLLSDIQANYGHWALAVAGFNAGAYRIEKALERSPSTGENTPPGLSSVTYSYIDKLRAWACLFSKPEHFGVTLPPGDGFTPLTTVKAPVRFNAIPSVAEAAGISANEVRQLNPAFRGVRLNGHTAHELLLPQDAAQSLLDFAKRVDNGEVPMPAPRVHEVEHGDTLSHIATRYGIALRDLLRLNHLTTRSILHIGQNLRLEP